MEIPNTPPNASLVPPSRTAGTFPREINIPQEGNTPFAQPMRTMKSDMARAIEEKNESLVSIALAEQRKKAAQVEAQRMQEKEKASVQDASPVAPRPHGRLFLVVVLAVLVGAVGTLGVLFVRVLPSLKIQIPDISLPNFGGPDNLPTADNLSPVAVPIILTPSLIPAQAEKKIDITGKSAELIFAEIIDEHSLGAEKGMVKNIYFTEEVKGAEGDMISQTISSRRLLGLLDFRVPEMLTRALEDDFMVGFLGEENATTPFLVLKVSTYDGGLAGILLWEKKLPYFFDMVFGRMTSATSSPQIVFRDAIIVGRDARVGEIGSVKGISYVFVDENTLLIAGSQSALEEIFMKTKGGSQ